MLQGPGATSRADGHVSGSGNNSIRSMHANDSDNYLSPLGMQRAEREDREHQTAKASSSSLGGLGGLRITNPDPPAHEIYELDDNPGWEPPYTQAMANAKPSGRWSPSFNSGGQPSAAVPARMYDPRLSHVSEESRSPGSLHTATFNNSQFSGTQSVPAPLFEVEGSPVEAAAEPLPSIEEGEVGSGRGNGAEGEASPAVEEGSPEVNGRDDRLEDQGAHADSNGGVGPFELPGSVNVNGSVDPFELPGSIPWHPDFPI